MNSSRHGGEALVAPSIIPGPADADSRPGRTRWRFRPSNTDGYGVLTVGLY